MEAEFIAAAELAKALVYLKRVITGFGIPLPTTQPILEDNTSAIYLSEKTSLNNPRTRHMNVRWHWLQEQVHSAAVKLLYCPTPEQVADVLTKNVSRPIFMKLAPRLLGAEPLFTQAIEDVLDELTDEDLQVSTKLNKPRACVTHARGTLPVGGLWQAQALENHAILLSRFIKEARRNPDQATSLWRRAAWHASRVSITTDSLFRQAPTVVEDGFFDSALAWNINTGFMGVFRAARQDTDKIALWQQEPWQVPRIHSMNCRRIFNSDGSYKDGVNIAPRANYL
ncbi:MAG: Ty1/Copia family ribonuclease HI, partial [Myxococcales bacterium]|nr:Ty1/Copia family ribonuclease HI [Myxococcales bacterium]